MRLLQFAVLILLFTPPAFAGERRVVIDPRDSKTNLFAPPCKTTEEKQAYKKMWKGIKSDIREQNRMKNRKVNKQKAFSAYGVYVPFMKETFSRCGMRPADYGESWYLLDLYEQAHKKSLAESGDNGGPLDQLIKSVLFKK